MFVFIVIETKITMTFKLIRSWGGDKPGGRSARISIASEQVFTTQELRQSFEI